MALVRQPTKSRRIRSAGYDPEARILEIEFQSGGVYQYDGVPQQTWDWFLRARSKTDFVENIIKPNYPFRKMSGPPPKTKSEQDLLQALARSLEQPRE